MQALRDGDGQPNPDMGGNGERVCPGCGASFQPRNPPGAGRPQTFCSTPCRRRYVWRTRPTGDRQVRCRSCGTSFTSPAKNHLRVYCPRCTAEKFGPRTEQETRACGWCGKPVTRVGKRLEAERWFCDPDHQHSWERQSRVGRRRAKQGDPAWELRCRGNGCSKVRRLLTPRQAAKFKTYDPSTQTYLCDRCRHREAGHRKGRLVRCAYPGCKNKRLVFPGNPHKYCSREHCLADQARKAAERRRPVRCAAGDQCVAHLARRAALSAQQEMPEVRRLKPSLAKRMKYCCLECVHIAQRQRENRREKRRCEMCPVEFYRTSAQSSRRFCSERCRVAWQRQVAAARRVEGGGAIARVQIAWTAGIRGPRRLARAAGTSLRTVYLLRDQGRDLGSDQAVLPPAVAHLVERRAFAS